MESRWQTASGGGGGGLEGEGLSKREKELVDIDNSVVIAGGLNG